MAVAIAEAERYRQVTTSTSSDTTTLLISPTEPASLRAELGEDICIVSDEPERYGADVLTRIWKYGQVITIGWQRKTYSDLVASMIDGRVYDFNRLRKLDFPFLVIEGKPHFTKTGLLFRSDGKPTKFTRAGLLNLERSAIFITGLIVRHTPDTKATAELILDDLEYIQHEKHLSLFRRPRPKGEWGITGLEEQRLFFMQGLPKIGAATAAKILRHNKGKIPMQWTVTADEMQKIEGIGKKTADALIRFLD